MQVLESHIETKVCYDAKAKLGIRSIKLTPAGQTGYQDRLFFMPGGRPLLIEFKRSGEEPEPKQEYLREELIDLGYNVKVCDNYDDAMEAIHQALEAAQVSVKGG